MSPLARNAITAFACAGILASASADAQNYPTRTIRLIVPFSPGGGNDVLGRIFAQHISAALGQTVVVDNRAGGGSNIGTEMTAHAAPDGYTLLYTTNSIAIAPSLYSKLAYTLNELAPIALVASFPIALIIHPSVPARNVPELVALAKKRGGLDWGRLAQSPNRRAIEQSRGHREYAHSV